MQPPRAQKKGSGAPLPFGLFVQQGEARHVRHRK